MWEEKQERTFETSLLLDHVRQRLFFTDGLRIPTAKLYQ